MRIRRTAARVAVTAMLAVSGLVAVAAPAHAEIDRNKCDTIALEPVKWGGQGTTIYFKGMVGCAEGWAANWIFLSVHVGRNGNIVIGPTAKKTCGPYTGFCVAEATYSDEPGDQRWCTVAEAFIRDNTGDKYSAQKDCEDEAW